MDDIRLEKFMEAMIEEYAHAIGAEAAKDCPILQNMVDNLRIKSSNNAEIRLELGMIGGSRECPCLQGK